MDILKVAGADPLSGGGDEKPNGARPLLTGNSELVIVATTLAVVAGVFQWNVHPRYCFPGFLLAAGNTCVKRAAAPGGETDTRLSKCLHNRQY